VPLYEYECKSCGHRFEKIRKFSDEPLTTCPNCGKETIEQLLSAPAVQFKGSGWYVTDYAKKSSSPGSSSPVNASTDSSSSKSETKSESKTESKPSAPASKSENK